MIGQRRMVFAPSWSRRIRLSTMTSRDHFLDSHLPADEFEGLGIALLGTDAAALATLPVEGAVSVLPHDVSA